MGIQIMARLGQEMATIVVHQYDQKWSSEIKIGSNGQTWLKK